MPNTNRYPYLMVITIILAFMFFGCSKESSLEPDSQHRLVDRSIAHSVKDYAQHHNTEVQHLLQLNQNLIQDFESLVQRMNERNPSLASDSKQINESQKVLPTLQYLHRRGHRPLEIFSFLQNCLREYTRDHEVQPEITAGLNSSIRFLISRDADNLHISLRELQKTADRLGSEDDKCVVGVFLGSFQRAQQYRSGQWCWPWIIVYDFIGSLMGGVNAGAVFSGWAELMFRDFPFHRDY